MTSCPENDGAPRSPCGGIIFMLSGSDRTSMEVVIMEVYSSRINRRAKRPRLLRPGEGGFTLLEVMFAMAVLAIALVAVFQSQSQSVAMLASARFETTAALLAKSKMAQLEAEEASALRSGRGDFGEDYPDYSWEVTLENTPLDTLVAITVVVTNSRMTRNNSYRIELFRTVAKE